MNHQMLVAGELVSGASMLGIVNPASGQVFAAAPRARAAGGGLQIM